MGLNETVSGERVHIGFFGLRNAGKSSLVNAITGQKLSVVSDVRGTTTDPVKKAMELLPIGPVVIIDTPGIDDEGELGQMRAERARQTLTHTDIAVLVRDATAKETPAERQLVAIFEEKGIPFITALNKSDLSVEMSAAAESEIYVSAKTGENINVLKDKIGALAGKAPVERHIIADLVKRGDAVVLVIPVDAAAPKGRIILPQQQTLRELLDCGCTAVCCQVSELEATLGNLNKTPRMVVTDSRAFGRVSEIVPQSTALTSFSILFARYKGDLAVLTRGAKRLETLNDGDRVLISEGCTHHRQCGDIGTQKLPAWIRKFSGSQPQFEFTSGGEFPENLSGYALAVHCGGCMLNAREMQSRISRAEEQGIPIVNYGVAIAHMHGILRRSLSVFPDIQNIL